MSAVCKFEGHDVEPPGGTCTRCGQRFEYRWTIRILDLVTFGPLVFRICRALWRRRRARLAELASSLRSVGLDDSADRLDRHLGR